MKLDEILSEIACGLCFVHKVATDGCAQCGVRYRAIDAVKAMAKERDENAAALAELRQHADLHGYAALAARPTPVLAGAFRARVLREVLGVVGECMRLGDLRAWLYARITDAERGES